MISPELLRRLPFFGLLGEEPLQAIAMIAEEISAERGAVVFEAGQPARRLYILLKGSIDLFYVVSDKLRPETRKEFPVGEINPGELFGISALIEPYVYTSSARAAERVQLIEISGEGLCSLCDQNVKLGYILMQRVAKAALERLEATRVQLAAAWVPGLKS